MPPPIPRSTKRPLWSEKVAATLSIYRLMADELADRMEVSDPRVQWALLRTATDIALDTDTSDTSVFPPLMPMTEGIPPDPDKLNPVERVAEAVQQVVASNDIRVGVFIVLLVVAGLCIATAPPPFNYIGVVSVILIALTPRR